MLSEFLTNLLFMFVVIIVAGLYLAAVFFVKSRINHTTISQEANRIFEEDN